MLYLICEPRNKSICSLGNATSSMPLKCPQKHAYQQILLPEKVLDEMEVKHLCPCTKHIIHVSSPFIKAGSL